MPNLHAHLEEEWQEIRLAVDNNDVYFWIALASAVDTPEAQEECGLKQIETTQEGDGWRAEVTWRSSIWQSKKHVYHYRGGRLEHWIELTGKGRITDLTYLSGTVDGNERGSVPGFGSVYVPCPNFLEKPMSHPSEYVAISSGNVTELWGSALNGGPLMFAFGENGQDGWLAAGLHVEPGAYGFQTMAFNKLRPSARAEDDSIIAPQAICLEYLGNEMVNGTWTSPKLVLFASKGPSTCTQEYCDDLRASGIVPMPTHQRAGWWSDPIFCSWHEQVALTQIESGGHLRGMNLLEASRFCYDRITQANMDRWLDVFQQHDIPIGTVIIDVAWQRDMTTNDVETTKFPDLRGFIDARHTSNQHVQLWMKAWPTEGLPKEWCVLRDGAPVMADPTVPEYREYIAQVMEKLLGDGPGCYNADGLKIDATNQFPGGMGLQAPGGIYGFELLHAYLKLTYDAARTVKDDAMVTLYTANPYFADCCNVVRLGDLYTFRGDPRHTMRWRAEVIRAGLPHALIDTDGCFRFSMRDDMTELLDCMIECGVPCLYQAEHLAQMRAFTPDRLRKFTPTDYALIRQALAAYDAERKAELVAT